MQRKAVTQKAQYKDATQEHDARTNAQNATQRTQRKERNGKSAMQKMQRKECNARNVTQGT